MPLMVCPKCTRFHYVPGECPAPRVAEEANSAGGGRKLSVSTPPATGIELEDSASGVRSAPLVDAKQIRKGDRHKPGYQAKKQKIYRERRAKAKT